MFNEGIIKFNYEEPLDFNEVYIFNEVFWQNQEVIYV